MKKLLWISALFIFSIFAGCSGGVQGEENKPVAEIKAEAEKLDVSALRSKIVAYKDEIVKRTADFAKLQDRLKAIPVTELAGEKAAQIKKDIEDIQAVISRLKERYQVYYDLLKSKGGDLSGLGL